MKTTSMYFESLDLWNADVTFASAFQRLHSPPRTLRNNGTCPPWSNVKRDGRIATVKLINLTSRDINKNYFW